MAPLLCGKACVYLFMILNNAFATGVKICFPSKDGLDAQGGKQVIPWPLLSAASLQQWYGRIFWQFLEQ